MADYSPDQIAALNEAAERFRKAYPREANRNMFALDLAGKYEEWEQLDKALDANYRSAAGDMHGRVSQQKKAVMREVAAAAEAWAALKREALQS